MRRAPTTTTAALAAGLALVAQPALAGAVSVPEPGGMALGALALGIAALGARLIRRR